MEGEPIEEIDASQIDALIERASKAEAVNTQLTQSMSGVAGSQKTDNFLHLQISTEEMLSKLEHFYRGDYEGEDPEGNIMWMKQEDQNLVTFNEFGVLSLMEIITKYIDKNTILSYYDSERIYEILADVGDDLILFMLCNYEKMGMDTYFKKTKFRLVVTTTVHIIESAYRRALGGRTLEEMNQSKVIGQFGSLPPPQQIEPQSQGRIAKYFSRRGR